MLLLLFFVAAAIVVDVRVFSAALCSAIVVAVCVFLAALRFFLPVVAALVDGGSSYLDVGYLERQQQLLVFLVLHCSWSRQCS